MHCPALGSALAALALPLLPVGCALAQADPHAHHQPQHQPQPPAAAPARQQGHDHDLALGPAGATYDLRWLDAMVQHHTGALRMSELVFAIGEPGVGALAREIWREQAQEIRAMMLWRRAWYPQAPPHPVSLRPGGDPDSLAALERMSDARITAMRMTGSPPTPDTRVVWFLEGMLHHHGGALQMARDALAKSTNTTVRRLAEEILVAQRREIQVLRGMLRHGGLSKPEYGRHDSLSAP